MTGAAVGQAAAPVASAAPRAASVAAELGRITDSLLRPHTLVELGVLAACLALAWLAVKALG